MTTSTEPVKVSMCTASRQYQTLYVGASLPSLHSTTLTGRLAVTSLQKDPLGETSDYYDRDICKVMEFLLPMGHIQCCQLVV